MSVPFASRTGLSRAPSSRSALDLPSYLRLALLAKLGEYNLKYLHHLSVHLPNTPLRILKPSKTSTNHVSGR